MRFLGVVFVVLSHGLAWGGQPVNIRLDPNGMSFIYPVFDSRDWILTQPDASDPYSSSGGGRVTHWGDEYYAQDWARGCGMTAGQRVYAGISGRVIWAGPRGPYGLTVVIHDQESGFALKYSHLSEAAVSKDELVLAGKSLVGRVGNTGNIRTGGCGTDPGAHLHLALFKGVFDAAARPVSVTSATTGSGATLHAAAFGYVSPIDLIKSSGDPTVYALYYGTRVGISEASYESHGLLFDKYRLLFDPLAGRVMSREQVEQTPPAHYLWPMRDHSLLKSTNSSTVYVMEDGRKQAMTYSSFMCRGLRFNEVIEVSAGERDGYTPIEDVPVGGCNGLLTQALSDWSGFARANPSFGSPELSSYTYHQDWDGEWDVRSMQFAHSSGQVVQVFHSTRLSDSAERYVGYWDPSIGSWNGWHRMR